MPRPAPPSRRIDNPPAQRLFFVVGMAVIAAASLWWAVLQGLGWAQPAPGPAGAMPAVAVHALVMAFGFFPMFFAGFLFGTGVKWLRLPAVPAAALAPAALAHALGWLAFAVALARGLDGLRTGGLVLVAGAWTYAMARLALLLLRASRADDRMHIALILLAGLAGALQMWRVAALGAQSDWPRLLAATRASVWSFVGLTFLAAAHRMIPFVAGTAVGALDRRWPLLLLCAIAAALAGRTLAEVLPAAARFVAPVECVVGAALVALAARWPFVQSLRPRMLRMLLTGFGWLGTSLLASGLGDAGWIALPDAVALHAFAAGFLGTTMLAMVSRVTAALAGRPIVVDTFLWGLFLALQASVLLRVAAPLAGQHAGSPAIAAAAIGWCAVWLPWALRYGRLLVARAAVRAPRDEA